MVYDIASELGEMYDLSRTVSSATLTCIAVSGILFLCVSAFIIFITQRKVGLRFFPIMYGFTAYLLFYIFIGGFLSNIPASFITDSTSKGALAFIRIIILILSAGCLVGGRFFAMWFIRKLYSEYSDTWSIGVGVSLTEGAVSAITILLNYSLCLTINRSGLVGLANTYETVEDAAQQIAAFNIFFENPSYYYFLSGLESAICFVFHAMVSPIYYAIYHNDIPKAHIATLVGLKTLLYLPGAFYSSGILFNRVSCFIIEAVVTAAAVYMAYRIHRKFYNDIRPKEKPRKTKFNSGAPEQKKMPKFNDNINKL